MKDGANIGALDFTALLWAGLRTHHPQITKDDCLGMLDDMGVEQATYDVFGALMAAAPVADDAAGAAGATGGATDGGEAPGPT